MFVCSCCDKPMPPDPGGFEIATNWTVIRIEAHRQTKIEICYHYLCPNCTFKLAPRQSTLPLDPPPAGDLPPSPDQQPDLKETP